MEHVFMNVEGILRAQINGHKINAFKMRHGTDNLASCKGIGVTSRDFISPMNAIVRVYVPS